MTASERASGPSGGSGSRGSAPVSSSGARSSAASSSTADPLADASSSGAPSAVASSPGASAGSAARAPRASRPSSAGDHGHGHGRSAALARRPLLLAAMAAAAVLTMTGGVVAAVTTDGPSARPGPGATPAGSGGTGAPSGAGVTNVADGDVTAPLQRVVPPDLLAVAQSPISAAGARKIGRIRGVRDVIVVAAGAVQLQGRQVNTFAVDPAVFRSWTPPGTARNQQLWAALARNEFVVSTTAAKSLGLRAGARHPIVAKTMPQVTMGGSGRLGLPGIDMLVSRGTGTELGLIPNLAVMVNAPGANLKTVSKGMQKILGRQVQVLNLHERKYQKGDDGSTGGASSYLDLYRRAARTCPGLSWTVLAAIGQIESGHGRNTGPSSAGALGPMQFMPATWKAYGVDGDGDNKADIMNPFDAVPGAAKYLCANGAGRGGRQLYRAIWHYNHADWYVQKVLALAKSYARAYA